MNVRRGFLVLTFSMVFFAAGCTGSHAGRSDSASAGVLTDAQHFTLASADGAQMSLDGLLASHKAVLLNFWATWCPPCREEIPDLIRLQEKHGGDDFTIVGIDIGESAARVKAFAEKAGINYPLLLDADSGVAESYGVVGIPTSLLVTSDGRVLGTYHAATPQLFTDVEKALAAS